MASQGDPPVTTQVIVAGFDASVSAGSLAGFLEYMDIGQVWRCRVKTSWTPPGSYPEFLHPAPSPLRSAPSPSCRRAPPHAFVHFALPQAVRRATDAAARSELLLHGRPLRIAAATASCRGSINPFRFPDAGLEVGTLSAPDTFLVAWRGPDQGLQFSVDPFDPCCRLVFARDTAFVLPPSRSNYGNGKASVVMRCDVKLEFPVRDVAEVRVYRSDCALLVRLSASPLVHYRTADGDDIHTPVPVDFDLPDDDDPWIRTGGFTLSGAIGRCWVYRIKISPRRLMKMDRALAYLEQQGVAIMECGSCYSGLPLTVRAEHPDFFCCVQEAEGSRSRCCSWAYCLPPEEELSNRLLRHYHHVADRFLRVTFMDEAMEPLSNNSLNFYAAPILRELMSDSFKHKTTVQMRVRTVMTKGFQMCGRKYSLLAFSPNQLRIDQRGSSPRTAPLRWRASGVDGKVHLQKRSQACRSDGAVLLILLCHRHRSAA
ncbi:hypothetical protein ZWY2020_052019 [Hordeum vulgare]|nr:hypothetical protein ZWY2020_052019 [Hordeum vulgare]